MLYLHGIKGARSEKVPSATKLTDDVAAVAAPTDDRVRNPRLLRRRTLLKRIVVRLCGSLCLFAVSIPGLCLWLPILLVAKRESDKLIRKGPVFEWVERRSFSLLRRKRTLTPFALDAARTTRCVPVAAVSSARGLADARPPLQIAQTKLTYGLLTGVAVVTLASLATFPLVPFANVAFVLALMWLTLRFVEDLFSSVRALVALARLVLLGKRQLVLLRTMRASLHARVERLAVERAGLPRDAGVFVRERERRWSRMGLGAVEGGLGRWLGFAAFFDPRRRRKKGAFPLSRPVTASVRGKLKLRVSCAQTGTRRSSCLTRPSFRRTTCSLQGSVRRSMLPVAQFLLWQTCTGSERQV